MVARLLCDGSLRVLRARVGARPLGETLRFGRVLHSMPRDLRPPVTPRSEELGESTIAACPSIHVKPSSSLFRHVRSIRRGLVRRSAAEDALPTASYSFG
jgi:hypothetical protein